MSSRFQVQRVCEFCQKEFIAKTTVTKYCSHHCNSKAFKEKRRNAKVEVSNQQTLTHRLKPINEIKAKEYLTVKDVAQLLSINIRTVYHLIENNQIKALKISERVTRIRKADIENLFLESEKQPSPKPIDLEKIKIAECYNMTEIQKIYSISEKGLHNIIKKNNIQKITKGRYTYVPKLIIHQIFNIDNHEHKRTEEDFEKRC